MKDYGYLDVYSAGLSLAELDTLEPGDLDPKSIIIYRYYDLVSSVFGGGKQVAMEDFGKGLSELILKIRDRSCLEEDKPKFKINLVGHSMGGLVIRCLLQNPKVGKQDAIGLVDKVFTYATPHNGIELDIVGNVPSFFNAHSVTNFNRDRMREYLGLPDLGAAEEDAVNTLDDKFDPDRFFCLVGTNAKDYAVAAGWSSRVVGPFSDGLVRINNAVLSGKMKDQPIRMAPRAYVHRSHSGYYGIVNSEEGYQNLVRFLFGDARVDGRLEIANISLPADVAQVDGALWLKNHYPGGYIFRDMINLEAIPPQAPGNSWRLLYGFDSSTPNGTSTAAAGQTVDHAIEFKIPIVQNTPPRASKPRWC